MLEKELQETEKGRRNAESERDGLRRELERITVSGCGEREGWGID